MLPMKIGFLGCGNMGEAFLKSIVKEKIVFPKEMLVCNRTKERNQYLVGKYGVFTTQNPKNLQSRDIIFLAIKPQGLETLDVSFSKDQIVISMLAGTPLSKLRKKFPESKLVRIMPNVGQYVNAGMTGVLYDTESSFLASEKKSISDILESGGKILEVANDKELDALALFSGCGPAYFFYFAEKLIEAAQEFGFSKEVAELLIRQTFIGAGEIVRVHEKDMISSWREKVTSKGGVTEQALLSFEKNGLLPLIKKAIEAAEKKTNEFGK